MGNLCCKTTEQPRQRQETFYRPQLPERPQIVQPTPAAFQSNLWPPTRINNNTLHQRSSISQRVQDHKGIKFETESGKGSEIEAQSFGPKVSRTIDLTPQVVYQSGGRLLPQRSDVQKKRFIKKASVNRQLLAACLSSIGRDISDFDLDDTHDYQSELTYDDHEYHYVSRKFGKRNFDIDGIKKVDNPFLLLSYELRKQQYRKTYGHVREMDLFHATKERSISEICKKNFDWRLKGRSKGVKFGQGVSFSPSSYYAHHYGDVMILAKVLVTNHCRGTPQTSVPPEGYDTTTNHDNKVFVKYEDESFYPAYVINYY